MDEIPQPSSSANQSRIASRARDCAEGFTAYLSDPQRIHSREELLRPSATPEESLNKECDSSQEHTAVPQVEDQIDWAEEQQARFRLWAANLGVFAKGQASIDHRLRDSSELQDLVLQLLDALCANLHICKRPSSSDDSSGKEILTLEL